jgi:calcium-sensing receptor
MKKVEVIPIIVGALGAVSNNLDKWIEKLGIHIRIELLQKTALLGTLWDSKNTEKKLGKLKSLGPEATGCSQLPRKKHSQHKNKAVKNM